MALVNKQDPKKIFASQAPSQDVPAEFNNYERGWDESRKNNGKPTIKQFNKLQQLTDEKILWIHQNGAALPFDETMEYVEGAVVVKDGVLQQWKGEEWKSVIADGLSDTVQTFNTPEAGVDPVTGVADGDYFNVRSSNDESYIDEYQNVGGNAVATGKRYLSALGVEQQEKPASTIKDASGKWQDEINLELLFKNAKILVPEMFGAVGDGVTDDTQALIDMFKACTDMPTGSGINLNTIVAGRNGTLGSYKKIRLTGLYRHTKPIHIPPNCWIEQSLTGSFSKNVGTIGLYYDPIPSEYDTYAVGFFLYKKDVDGTYSLDTSPYTLPAGTQFDNNTWVMTGNRILLDNLSITTNPNVTLGFRAVGFAGSCFRYINIGTNDGSSSRNPKVAVLTNGGWNSVFEKPTTLSSVQGWVNWGSNGGMTVNQPYINRGYNATPLDSIVPIYKPTDFTATGAVGIVNRGDAYWNQPITEHWYYNYVVENSYLRCNHPHVEGTGTKNCFYFVGTSASAEINFKPTIGVNTALEKASLIYLKNCDIQNTIVLRGKELGASPIVYGENSSACVYVKLDRNHWFIQSRKWGDLSLIAYIENHRDKVIYVDPVNGNDEAVGLRDINALKTLAKVKMLAEKANIREVNLASSYTHAGYLMLHKDVIFTGAELIVSGGTLEFNDRNLDVHFNNSKFTAAAGVIPIQVRGVSYGNFSFTCELANQTTLINCQNNANLIVNVTNNTITDKTFVSCAANYKAYVHLNLKTTSALTAAPVGANVTLLSAPHMLGSTSVAAQTIPAGERTALATMVLGGIRLGDNVSLSYTENLSGLDLKGYVSANNTVSYYFENRTNSAVNLASGNVNAKRV